MESKSKAKEASREEKGEEKLQSLTATAVFSLCAIRKERKEEQLAKEKSETSGENQ